MRRVSRLGDSRKKVLAIAPVGPWVKTIQKLGSLPTDLKTSFAYSQEKALKKLVRIVKRRITNSEDLAPKLDPSKAEDSRPLIDTTAYLTSIKTWRQNYVVYAGVKRGLLEPKSKIEIARLAWMLEAGTRRMQARPVWVPALEEMGGEVGIVKMFRDDFSKALKRKWGEILSK